MDIRVIKPCWMRNPDDVVLPAKKMPVGIHRNVDPSQWWIKRAIDIGFAEEIGEDDDDFIGDVDPVVDPVVDTVEDVVPNLEDAAASFNKSKKTGKGKS